MDKSLKIFIIVVLLLAVVVTIILMMTNKPKNSKNFKSRFDELDNCHDICFEKFPFQWQSNKRQDCMNTCLPDEGLNKGINWIDKFTNCVDNKCNIEKCYNLCDTQVLPPLKPERSRFDSDEDFYRSLDEWEISYANYLKFRENCYNECNADDTGTCRQKCCEDAKMCDAINGEKDKMKCKASCESVCVMKRM